MKCCNDYLAVEFDREYQKEIVLNGLTLIKPDQWLHEEGDGERTTDKYAPNTDLREINSQIATVVVENHTVNERGQRKCSIKKGQQVFLHYLQFDQSTEFEIENKLVNFVNYRGVFFVIHGEGDYEMAPDTYLAQQVQIEAPRTPSGIYTCSDEALVRDTLKAKITHAPKDGTGDFKVGDIVICADENDYTLKIHGQEYIKLTGQWMTSKIEG